MKPLVSNLVHVGRTPRHPFADDVLKTAAWKAAVGFVCRYVSRTANHHRHPEHDGRKDRRTNPLFLRKILSLCLAFSALSAGAENLLKDPSFENHSEPNRFGLVFPEWGGWIYEPPARFVVSSLARTGKCACEMVAGMGSKIRIYSQPGALPPGRYRATAWLRGLDIAEGSWSTDFAMHVDGPWFRLDKNGTFGWTPLNYTFDVAPGDTKEYRIFLGLGGSGRLWVDDAALEKVADTEPLTPKPVLGNEEAPISPPGSLSAKAIRCPECSYRNEPSSERCYACGAPPAQAAARSGSPALLFADFESASIKPFQEGTLESQRPLAGKGSLRLEKGYTTVDAPMDWSDYDYLRFEVFNPSAQPVPLALEVHDAKTRDYWTRVNLHTVAPPGRSTVSIPTALYVGEKSRPGRPLLRDQVRRLAIAVDEHGPVVLDNFRLERLDTASVRFPELLALHFGPDNSPLCEGFERAGSATIYTAGRGLGWVKAGLWRSVDARQPDTLARSFVCVTSGDFRVDLPNGKYHGMMMVDSPAGYWGELPNYRHRSIKVNGTTVVDDGWDFDSYRNWYFRNASTEDSVADDPFDRYVSGVVPERRFEFEVTDGKLEITFQGADWSICLSALVIYPDAKKAEGEKFLAWVLDRRREQFAEQFKRGDSPGTGETSPAEGVRLFRRHPMDLPMAQDGPRPGEEIPSEGLSVVAAAGEETVLVFSAQVAAATKGEISLVAHPFVAKGGVALPTSALLPGWIDYRLSRVTFDGGVYAIRPRYWHPGPAPDSHGLTRTFWVRVRIPVDAKPGDYRGSFTLEPGTASPVQVPASLRVHPFKLDVIRDVAVGPLGARISLPWREDDPLTRQWNERLLGSALDVLKEAGATSFSGLPALRASAANGKITLDTADADREMAMARERGFDQMVSAYGAGTSLGYRMYGNGVGSDESAAKAAGFPDMAAFLKALWTEVDAHAVKAGWLKVAWNLCDEPLGDAIPGAIKNALAHRTVTSGLSRTTFMGFTSQRNDDPNDPHLALALALPLPALNLHNEAAIRAIHDAGNEFVFYNGGVDNADTGSRWTYGRYLRMLVAKEKLAMRLTWHFNIVAGNPYYALDCREDDYCWFNTNAAGDLVPSLGFLGEILPGLNDYRYLATLDRLLREKPDHAAAATARKVYDEMIALTLGTDCAVFERRRGEGKLGEYDKDRARIVSAIESLLDSPSR